MITGAENNYALVLRTGAWDRDIFIPRALAGIISGGIGAAAVADAEIYRAYTFENNFWKWINKIVNELGKENASTPSPHAPYLVSCIMRHICILL